MSGWTKNRDTIKQQLVGKTGVRVLVVEGKDDAAFFTALLDKRASGIWATQWAIGSAEGKQNVLKILDDQPDWIGIVDRDEWSENAANKAKTDRPGRLHVLPRFCMESYFVQPAELWHALPDPQQSKINGDMSVLETAVFASLDQWVRHGALWHAVNPLWDGLRALGFKEDLLDLQNAQNDSVIQAKFQEWHDLLEPNGIMQQFRGNLTTATAASVENRLKHWVHGKKFFAQHVSPELNHLLGQRSSEDWRKELTKTLQLPSDLEFLWTAMGF